MEIIDLDKESNYSKTAIGLGNFDGIHVGHQKLIKQTIACSKKNRIFSSILLFKRHSRYNVQKEYLSSLDDKIDLLSKFDLDIIFLIDFNENFKNLSSESFISHILKGKCNSSQIVIGNDYKFGRNAQGNYMTLKDNQGRYHYDLNIIDDVRVNGSLVSSTLIKDLLRNGEIEKANDLLSRFYRIKGQVTSGYGRGKKLGYPTANIKTNFNYLIPADGVYYTITEYNKTKYHSMTSIGNNPTFTDGGAKKTIEVYIDDFNENIYNENISLYFVKYLRPMIKFDKVGDLVDQLDDDHSQIKKLSSLYNI